MSAISGKVGAWELGWSKPPRGKEGTATLQVSSPTAAARQIEVSWRRDRDGIWIEVEGRVYGFDIRQFKGDDDLASFDLERRGAEEAYRGLRFRSAGEANLSSGAGASKKGVRIKAQMPGKILRLIAKAGDSVAKDQPILVMEAMKMENEIRAPGAGRIKELRVSEGDVVETGQELVTLE